MLNGLLAATDIDGRLFHVKKHRMDAAGREMGKLRPDAGDDPIGNGFYQGIDGGVFDRWPWLPLRK